MRRRIILSLLLGCLVAGAHVLADDTPPKNLHKVGDHWTAWNPPQTFPEGAELYTIVRGDTLWDLAGRFYGDPYLWPQLWERNQYILDAHWIYPGDPLLLGVEVVPVDSLAELEGEDTGPDDGEEGEDDGILSADEALGKPIPLGTESDIYCSGFIGEMDEEFPHRIIGSESGALLPDMFATEKRERSRSGEAVYGIVDTAKYGLATSDVVYVDGGSGSGLTPGDLFTIVEPRQQIRHPHNDRAVGRLYSYQGRLRILSVQQDTAIAEIVHACDPVTVGSRLMPFEPEPVPLGRDTPLWPINQPASTEQLEDAPVILYGRGDVVSMGQDNLVYIDRGLEDDVLPGDLFTIYRINRPGLPPVVLGELAVLSAHEETSVARILKSRYAIFLGDRLALK